MLVLSNEREQAIVTTAKLLETQTVPSETYPRRINKRKSSWGDTMQCRMTQSHDSNCVTTLFSLVTANRLTHCNENLICLVWNGEQLQVRRTFFYWSRIICELCVYYFCIHELRTVNYLWTICELFVNYLWVVNYLWTICESWTICELFVIRELFVNFLDKTWVVSH